MDRFILSHLCLSVLFLGLLVGCSPTEKRKGLDTPVSSSDSIHYKVIRIDDDFGYDIYVNSRKVLHQPMVPGIEGGKGFTTPHDAMRTARLVVLKMKKGIVPPTVTPDEISEILGGCLK